MGELMFGDADEIILAGNGAVCGAEIEDRALGAEGHHAVLPGAAG